MKVSLKSKLKHKSVVILESRPYKFKSQERKGKPRTFNKGDRYEPMTDAELAAALNIHVKEVEEFFESYYDDIPDPQILHRYIWW